ncbi:Protein of unknown function [Lactobacillus helveticus CIRM-BIA 103]|nr:Protein of unknown function [Lactobacillus helveticus CIRM-BIA 103]
MKNRTNLVELVLFLVAPHTWRIRSAVINWPVGDRITSTYVENT